MVGEDSDRALAISLLCPTRSRPAEALRLATCILKTARIPNRVELLFYLDDNDPKKLEYIQLFQGLNQELSRLKRCELIIGEQIGLLKSTNELARLCQGDLLILTSDDQIYNDSGWDTCLDREVKKYPDEIFCMWFNDGHWREKLCTFPIISRRWCLTLGYCVPGFFERLFADLWIADIAQRVGRLHYIPHILTEHLHWAYGKGNYDETYSQQLDADGRIKPVVKRDMDLFAMTAHYREADARKIAAVMDSPITLQPGTPVLGKSSIFDELPPSPRTQGIEISIEEERMFSKWIETLKLQHNSLPFCSQTSQSLATLSNLADRYRPTKIVELGAGWGLSLRCWLLASWQVEVTSIDFDLANLHKSEQFIPLDLSKIKLLEQDILTVDFSQLWQATDKVLLYINASDRPGVPILEHILDRVLPLLPINSLVVIDNIWYSPTSLMSQHIVARFWEDSIFPQIDPAQDFEGYFASYWKGGSVFGRLGIIHLMNWVNTHQIELLVRSDVKLATFLVNNLPPFSSSNLQSYNQISFNSREKSLRINIT